MENYENNILLQRFTLQILFTEEDITRLHDTKFLKKYGTLYNFLNHLLTNEISTNDANVDQICLVIT